MGPFLTGEDEYSPDLNKNRLQEAGLANVLGALYGLKGGTTTRELVASLKSLATAICYIDIHAFVDRIRD